MNYGNRPDFSGSYVLNREASTLSPGASTIQTGSMQIKHSEPQFRYHVRYMVHDQPLEFTFELVTDGRESQIIEDGASTAISLRWDGNALIFLERNQGTVTFRHELLEAGRLLRVTEENRGMGRDQDNIFIFEREYS
jgi:hypothetical protein